MNLPENYPASGRSPIAHRPVHYLGSKLRLTTEIAALVDELNPSKGLVCDLFSGSGVVSSVLGQLSPVVAVDIQEYARVLASALLNPAPIQHDLVSDLCAPITDDPTGARLLEAWRPLLEIEQQAMRLAADGDPEALSILLESLPLVAVQAGGESAVSADLRSVFSTVLRNLTRASLDQSVDSVISRYFGGLYFGVRQAIELDVLARRARSVGTTHSDLVMGALLSTASAAVGTVGKQFAQPLRPRNADGTAKPGLWKRIEKDRSLDVLGVYEENLRVLAERHPALQGSTAVRADYRDFLASHKAPIEVVYADPPYTRDHYSRYYHVLETIALGDQPDVSRSNLHGGRRVSRGVYRQDRHQSPFSICSQAPDAFETLMRLTSDCATSLVLSYSPQLAGGASRPRVMAVTDLESAAGRYFGLVRRIDLATVSHSKLTRTDMHLSAPDAAEILLVCTP